MKKLKISLLALVFTMGIGTAVVQKIHAAPKADEDTYNWLSTSSAPENPSSELDGATVGAAEDHFGCTTGIHDCATGTDPNGVNQPVTIKFN